MVTKLKDNLFINQQGAKPFEFNEKVARVFDDMLERSVPFYQECQSMVVKLCSVFAQEGTVIIDLGCSTGALLEKLAATLQKNIRLVGLDNSVPMLDKAYKRLCECGTENQFSLICSDVTDEVFTADASVVIMNYTLQFISAEKRAEIVSRVFRSLRPGGCFILIEKLKGEGDLLEQVFIDLHHAFKQNQGYSKIEISRKKKALEDVLIPFNEADNLKLLRTAGFKEIAPFFRWFNFAGFIALK